MRSETWNWKVELVLLDVGIDHDGAARGGLHAIEAQLQGLRTKLFGWADAADGGEWSERILK